MLRKYLVWTITGLILLLTTVKASAPVEAQSTGGTLLLNEISPWPSDSMAWIELINPGDEAVALDGWTVEFLSGFSYKFPEGSGDVAGGGLHLLNIDVSGGNPFSPDGDGCILSSADEAVDAITWGTPPEGMNIPLQTGIPVWPEYEAYSSGQNIFDTDGVLFRIPGTEQNENPVGNENWAYRTLAYATRGSANPWPGPWLMLPEDEALLASDFHLAVSGLEWAESVTFQIASDAAFTDIVIEQMVEGTSPYIDDIPSGTYFWHVRGERTDGTSGEWSPSQEFTRLEFDLDDIVSSPGQQSAAPSQEGALLASKGGGTPTPQFGDWSIIGLGHLYQQKDTDMLCLDGEGMHGDYAWDVAHPKGAMYGRHNPKYCVRACLAMVAGQFGNVLSQDRISYHIFEEMGTTSSSAVKAGHIGDPYMDLGHGRGAYDDDAAKTVDWIYGVAIGTSQWLSNSTTIFEDPTPAKDSIREIIDANRPVMFFQNHHARIIDGYMLVTINMIEHQFVHIVDPWYTGPTIGSWENFQPVSDASFVFPPTNATPQRVDEPELAMDSDADGIVDFDETNRFHTDPNNVDSDVDGVYDKEDMLGYLFTPEGAYEPRERDIDSDGVAKELDPDNDDPNDMGSRDGCEDANGDGFYGPGDRETSCFNLGDDYEHINPECLRGFVRWEVHASRHDSEADLEYYYIEEVKIQPGDSFSDEYTHPHTYEQSMDYSDSIGSTSVGSNSQSGFARAEISEDPETGEYYLSLEVNTPDTSFTVTTTVLGRTIVNTAPIIYEMDYVEPWNMGVPEQVDGGLLCKGEWETVAGMGVEGPAKWSWEVWIVPPASQ